MGKYIKVSVSGKIPETISKTVSDTKKAISTGLNNTKETISKNIDTSKEKLHNIESSLKRGAQVASEVSKDQSLKNSTIAGILAARRRMAYESHTHEPYVNWLPKQKEWERIQAEKHPTIKKYIDGSIY